VGPAGERQDRAAGPEGLRERTRAYSLRIINLCRELRDDEVARTLGRQLLRSGTSPGAHYREASRARSTAEFISKMNGGLQELDETAYWLELLIESNTIPKPKLSPLYDETQELIAIFVACIRNAGRGD
jgi:four helix bundle protein